MKKVIVCFDGRSAEYAETHGIKRAVTESKKEKNSDWDVQEFNFKTEAEADAFTKGLELANGWDAPYWEKK